MLYGTAQAGWNPAPNQGKNLTDLVPGESITMLDGTETLVNGSKSVAFAKGYSPTGSLITTFTVSGGIGAVIDIQAANQDVDGDYFSVTTITADGSGNGAASDEGAAAFYRAVVTTAGGNPVLIARML